MCSISEIFGSEEGGGRKDLPGLGKSDARGFVYPSSPGGSGGCTKVRDGFLT